MKKTILPMTLAAIALFTLCMFSSQEARAELATREEMERACENWLTYMVHQRGSWAGESEPRTVDVREITWADTVLALSYSIAPSGYIVVPALKELPPIKAYSERSDLDIDQAEGFPRLLRDALLHRIRLYVETYGSLEAVQPADGEVLFDRVNRREWDRYTVGRSAFKYNLNGDNSPVLGEAGPLMDTSWHQSEPYNDYCPIGYQGNTCVVGCVATATAQIMKYWEWPPSGILDHNYNWDGDDSCDGNVGGGLLSADLSDPYDWDNMPDSCDTGCSSEQEAAVAELCYEVGVAFEMDYGVCGSGTMMSRALTVLPTYFLYDSSIDREDRFWYTPETWFDLIQEEINEGCPMLYRIYYSVGGNSGGHAIVCDGWRDTGGQNQYHINYGWGGAHTAWFAIDNIYGSSDPSWNEYLIRNVMPVTGGFLVRPDGTGDYPTIQAAIDAASDGDVIQLANGTFTGAGNRDIDFNGKAITVCSLSDDPEACIIDCQGSDSDPHRGFCFHSGEGPGSVIRGITITNGCMYYPSDSWGGALYIENCSPIIENCIIVGNQAEDMGGGMYIDGNSSTVINNSTFYGNNAEGFGGGGICFDEGEGNPILTNCLFSSNSSSTGHAGGVCAREGKNITMSNCVLQNNTGGGLSCESASALLENCIFINNSYWGLRCFYQSYGTVTNCTFAENSKGILIDHQFNPLILDNVIIAFSTQGMAIDGPNGTTTLTCCDIFGNAGGDWVGCIEDQYGIDGNISEDPLFCDPEGGDYHLYDNSPCAPFQQPECGLIGALDVGCSEGIPPTPAHREAVERP